MVLCTTLSTWKSRMNRGYMRETFARRIRKLDLRLGTMLNKSRERRVLPPRIENNRWVSIRSQASDSKKRQREDSIYWITLNSRAQLRQSKWIRLTPADQSKPGTEFCTTLIWTSKYKSKYTSSKRRNIIRNWSSKAWMLNSRRPS